MAEIRKRIVFSRKGQGVGFRFTAKHLAEFAGAYGLGAK